MPFHRHLKHWLIPHQHNDHRPHLIRLHGLALMALLIMGVQVTANLLLRSPQLRVLAYATDITPVDLLNQTNQVRAAHGLPPLRLDARLNQSAALKAQNMFAEDYWNHVSPSCIQPWYWFNQAGYTYQYAGENLAKDFDTTAGVMDGWMNSPGHAANILNTHYTDVGFAVQNGALPTGSGTTPSCAAATPQTNGPTTLVVAHYGSTAGTSVVATVPSPTPKPAVKPAATALAPTPAPTPAPASAATPAVTAPPTPASSPSASPRATPVVAVASPTQGAPPPQSYSLFKPLSLLRTLGWGTLATIALLVLLLLVYALTHLTVWRKGLRRWRSLHYRLYAAAELTGLAVAILLLAVSGFGKVS